LFLCQVVLLRLFLNVGIKIVLHHKSIFKRPDSVEAGMGKLWMVLVHLVDWARFDIQFWESEVSSLENVFLVKLWNAF